MITADLKQNYYAFWLAAATGVNLEQAFAYLEGRQKILIRPMTGRRKKCRNEERTDLTEEDTQDMVRMREQGLSLKEIGQIYCLRPGSVSKRIKRYQARGG